MFILRAQLVRLILGTGQFGWLETRLTAASLGLFSFALFASSLIPLIARAFFSFQDTKTPVIIAIFSMALNIILCFLFVWQLSFPNIFQNFMINFFKLQGIKNISVIGLPLALSISGIFQISLLLTFLYRKIGDFKQKEICQSLIKILISGTLMIPFIYLILKIAAIFVNMQTFLGVFLQTISAGLAGAFIYVATTTLLKSPELKAIKSSILSQFTK